MKKILLSILLMAGLAVTDSALATGSIGLNPYQTGTVTFSGTNQILVTPFPYPFTVNPALILTATTTNATPLTNSAVTTTNFTLSVATTNVVVNWTAYAPFTRIEIGTNSIGPSVLITNTFPYPYVYLPNVWVQGSALNTNNGFTMLSITNLSTTNFVIYAPNTNQWIHWQAIGPAYNPGPNTVTY